MKTKQITRYIADDGREFDSEEVCRAYEARCAVDEVIDNDDFYHQGCLHIDGAGELEAFLIRHEELVLKMMGWKK